MQSTIDKAGRVVIPVSIRRKVGLSPGTALSITYEDERVIISRDVPGPTIEERQSRRVVRATASNPSAVDVAERVEEERNRWPR